MKVQQMQKTDLCDPEKVEKCLIDMVEVLRKHHMTVGELLLTLGNLSFTVGASIEGYTDTAPADVSELQKAYYENPRAGLGLMLDGLTITTWYDDWANQFEAQEESRELKKSKKSKDIKEKSK